MVRQASAILSETQPQVFVSYARQDAEKVLEIARLLENEGATVWRDGDHILGGQYYGEEIVHAIAHSRVVMLMCSPQAFHSDNVHREVLLTWDYYHRRYIPVWLGPVADIPDRFRYCLVGCQWIDAHSQPPERWLPQLLKAFKALGVETKNPAESTPRPDHADNETDRRAACDSTLVTSRFGARTGNWSGSWARGVSARSGRPTTPTCRACRRWP